MSASFVEAAEAALRGEPPAADVELLNASAPSILDATGRRALVSPLLAAFVWAGAFFRENLSHPLDPLALLLRLLALALSVRALLLGAGLLRRLLMLARRERYKLVLCDGGLLLRTPRADFAVAKSDIVDICERGAWQEHEGARWAEVYVVTRPESGRTHLALPPLFARTPGVLAERLMRWRGPWEKPSEETVREPAPLASKLFEAVAAGERPPGVTVIEHGRGFLRRGPYATVLLGFALLDGVLRVPETMRSRLGAVPGLVIVLCVVLVPLSWLFLSRRELASRRGAALLLTPAELLFRTRAGVQRVRLSDLGRPQIQSRRAWSILEGQTEQRTLVLTLKNGETLRYAEALLDAPLEVVTALCEGYRKGLLP